MEPFPPIIATFEKVTVSGPGVDKVGKLMV